MGEENVTAPRVSVIVPTRNRAELLAKLLGSLGRQTVSDFEIVLVDDGSTDNTEQVVAAAGLPQLRHVRTEGVGAVEARCAGVKASKGEVLAFTDDDCQVAPDWLARGLHAIEGGADVVQGRTVPERAVHPLERSIEHAANDGLFPTCNVFYRRAAYDAVGGFDRFAEERMGFRPGSSARALGFGEDTALGWAVARCGPAAAEPEALVRHAVVRPPLRELFYRTWMAGAFPVLIKEIPELRRSLVRKRFLFGRSATRLGAYGIVGFLIPGLQPLGAIACAGWMIARYRALERRGGGATVSLRALAVGLALDVTMCAALLVGSARARTLIV